MNRAEFIEAISRKKIIAAKDVARTLDAYETIVAEELMKGNKIGLMGFGTYECVDRNEKKCRNPHTGEVVKVPARKVPVLRLSKTFKAKFK